MDTLDNLEIMERLQNHSTASAAATDSVDRDSNKNHCLQHKNKQLHCSTASSSCCYSSCAHQSCSMLYSCFQHENAVHNSSLPTTASATASSSSSSSSSLTLRRFYALLLFLTFCSSAYACGPGRGIGGRRRNHKLTPLVFKQHVPNMSEKTLGASGLHEGAIKRDSPKFMDLVPNYNKDIIFKDEEGTGEDRLMTRRCKEKLNTLAISVMNQWPGVRLRVTESWDEDNIHGVDSLHYEGRAVDITTSDRDRTKYGMLARLAVEAGFDWVYYESRAHIHCSVKSDSSHIPHVSGCFSTDSTVLTSNGIRKQMSDLTIGDRVLSMNKQGEATYSEVILFMDRNLEQMQEFVQIQTEDGAALTVTPSHLVMVWNPKKSLMGFVFADRVEENDFVLVHDKEGKLRPQRVVQLKAIMRKGVVAPLTREGTIVVNSVAASCYAIVNSQKLAHWGLAPMRLMATLKSWMQGSGSSNRISTTDDSGTNVSDNEVLPRAAAAPASRTKTTTATSQQGIHWYAKALYTLKDYVVPQTWRYQ